MSNTWETYSEEGDNPGKPELIPHKTTRRHLLAVKYAEQSVMLLDGPAAYQLVGKVMAYQGYDGYPA